MSRGSPGAIATRPPARSTTEASSVGSSPAGQARVGGGQGLEAERLGRLGSPQALARLGLRGVRAVAALQSVGNGQGGNRAIGLRQGREQVARRGRGSTKGLAASCTNTGCAPPQDSAARPACTDCARVSPPATARQPRPRRRRRPRPAAPAATTTIDLVGAGRDEASTDHRTNGRPPNRRQALGSPGPARRPMPAATTTAEKLMVVCLGTRSRLSSSQGLYCTAQSA